MYLGRYLLWFFFPSVCFAFPRGWTLPFDGPLRLILSFSFLLQLGCALLYSPLAGELLRNYRLIVWPIESPPNSGTYLMTQDTSCSAMENKVVLHKREKVNKIDSPYPANNHIPKFPYRRTLVVAR